MEEKWYKAQFKNLRVAFTSWHEEWAIIFVKLSHELVSPLRLRVFPLWNGLPACSNSDSSSGRYALAPRTCQRLHIFPGILVFWTTECKFTTTFLCIFVASSLIRLSTFYSLKNVVSEARLHFYQNLNITLKMLCTSIIRNMGWDWGTFLGRVFWFGFRVPTMALIGRSLIQKCLQM